MAETQDVNLLKRRGRRRLVGAVALVLVAVIVLPMVFDPEPRQNAPAISVRIPSEDESRFSPKLAPQPPVEKAPAVETASAAPAAESARPVPAPSVPAVAPPKAVPKPAPEAPKVAAVPSKPAPPATGKGDFVIQVAALGEDEKVKALVDRLVAEKLPHYTEPVAIAKGKVTRVRVGPFASREAAERALKALNAMGLKPGGILERP